MAAMSVSPSRLLTVAIGKEAAYGGAVTPTFLIPVTACAPKDAFAPIRDVGWRGSVAGTYGMRPGPSSSSIDLGGPLLADAIGWFLVSVLGSDTVTGASAPFSHAITALNTGTQQPPSYTLVTADPVGALAWAGCRVSSLAISLSPDKIAEWTASCVGLSGAVASAPAVSPSGVPVLPSWLATLSVGGVAEAAAEQLEVTISRAVMAKRNTDGSRDPYLQRSEVLTVKGSATLVLTTDNYRQWALAATSKSIDVTLSQGAGAGLTSLTLHSSLVQFTSAVRAYGQRWVECDVEWEADGATADAGVSGGYSPIKATLQNAIGAGVYS